jgi:hypothetical protein
MVMKSDCTNPNNFRWTVINPCAEYEVETCKCQSVPADLSYKKVCLFWNGKPSGDILLQSLAALLQQKYKNIKCSLVNAGFPAPPDVLQSTAKDFDLVIAAIGD